MARKRKEVECINKGYVYPDGTLHPEPPEELIERVRQSFQIEYENSLTNGQIIEQPQAG